MAKNAIGTGALLIALTMWGLAVGGYVHFTQFIPAVLGLLIAVFGLVARDEKKRKHAMHGAVLLGLFGVLGAVPFIAKLPAALRHDPSVTRPMAVYSSTGMFLICLVFVVMCVQSFTAARKSGAV